MEAFLFLFFCVLNSRGNASCPQNLHFGPGGSFDSI
jgi:hypothetical protein